MIVIHAHFSLHGFKKTPAGMYFWAETSTADQPYRKHARSTSSDSKPRPRKHPFTVIPPISQGTPAQFELNLPCIEGIPLPSSQLIHTWDFDRHNVVLAPVRIEGIFLPLPEALGDLLAVPSTEDSPTGVRSGADLVYWNRAASLALELLADEKILPTIDTENMARWLPVMDGTQDVRRFSILENAMPSLCRAQPLQDGQSLAVPRDILAGFINRLVDDLVRSWGETPNLSKVRDPDSPALVWITSLLRQNPKIALLPGQLQALNTSYRAWQRKLHLSGDSTLRVAFKLDPPSDDKAAWQLHYALQSRDDPSLIVPAEIVWNEAHDTLIHLGRRFENPQERLLTGLGHASRLFPPIIGSLKGKTPTGLEIEAAQAYDFLRSTAPILEGTGFGILTPPWWNKKGARLGVRVKMNTEGKSSGPSHLSFNNLVNFQWQLSIGETELSEAEFLALVKLKSPFVQIRGQWVTLDPEQVETAIKFWEKQKQSDEILLLDALHLALDPESKLGGVPVDQADFEGWLADWLETFTQSNNLEQLPPPTGLDAQLRPYQVYGYSWMSFLRRSGLGACLADDMGLGKTIQTISLLVREKEINGQFVSPVLLIAPTSVVTNWEREIQKFAPCLSTYVHRGINRRKGADFQAAIQGQDVVLTSYSLARLDASTLQSMPWLAVILDEAQNIKNPETRQTQAIRQLNAGFRIALTGTPVENRLSELWSIMNFLNPGYLGSRKGFQEQFAIPIERYQNPDQLTRLKQLTNPFILRRVKTDPTVISDLPEKVETKEYCSLSEEQATLYEAVVQDAIKGIEKEEGIQRRGMVLSMMMQLKQVCNHPAQYLHQVGSATSEMLLVNRSGKLERLCELLAEVLTAGERSLIFTQFAEMGEMLAASLPGILGVSTFFLHGGTPAQSRDRMVRRFQEEENAPPIFILSLKAGGTGLNLTRANHVFHFDRWWNPAVEDQATDRAFRIGQQHNVQVHKFITTGTLEEIIDDMITFKKGLAQAVVGSGENWLTDLSTDELRKLVRLRREP